MVRDPFRDDAAPDLQEVLDALDDPHCRKIMTSLDTPATAREIADASGVPLSTTYRKLELLTDASILAERTELRQDGHHTTRYELTFAAITISMDGEGKFDVTIERRPASPDERLARLWSEVSRET